MYNCLLEFLREALNLKGSPSICMKMRGFISWPQLRQVFNFEPCSHQCIHYLTLTNAIHMALSGLVRVSMFTWQYLIWLKAAMSVALLHLLAIILAIYFSWNHSQGYLVVLLAIENTLKVCPNSTVPYSSSGNVPVPYWLPLRWNTLGMKMCLI